MADAEAMDRRRKLIRMAVRLHEQLLESGSAMLISLPEQRWDECLRLVRLHEKAVRQGWFAADQRVRPQMDRALRDFQQALVQMLARQKHEPLPTRVSLRELHAELVSLFEEFDEVECDLRGRTVSVITELIVLEDVDLGPFRIELDSSGGEGPPGYSVIATDPNGAACDEEVTHPHVRDGNLCAGEGALPIRRALQAGRLGDFFQIVTSILHTYYPGSAYVALDAWEGAACAACGTSVNDDERTSCSRSGDPVCYDCVVTCPDCDRDFAPDHTERCQECDERFCTQCLDEGFCDDCRKDADQDTEQEKGQSEQSTETPSGRCGERAAGANQTEPMETALA